MSDSITITKKDGDWPLPNERQQLAMLKFLREKGIDATELTMVLLWMAVLDTLAGEERK